MKTIDTLRAVASSVRQAGANKIDAILATGMAGAVAVVIGADLEGTGRASLPAYLFALGFGGLLLVRRRHPRAVLVLTVLGIFGYYALGFPPIGISLPAAGAVYSAAEQNRTRAAVASGAVLVAVSAYFRISEGQPQSYLFSYELVTNIALLAAATALGVTVRTQREARFRQEQLDALAAAERARHAEALVHAERMRMARDLHDVIGHTMSVISLHSNVAAEAIGRDDGAAKRAVEQIRAAASATMKELRSTVRLLRTQHQEPDVRSTAGLDAVARLADAAREAGLDVNLDIKVAPGEVSTTIDAAAYRIIQESLTNVLRHSGASVVRIGAALDNGVLGLEVTDNGTNGGGDAVRASNGHGLIGMHERVSALGGDLSVTGPSPDGFSVRARLPARLDP